MLAEERTEREREAKCGASAALCESGEVHGWLVACCSFFLSWYVERIGRGEGEEEKRERGRGRRGTGGGERREGGGEDS